MPWRPVSADREEEFNGTMYMYARANIRTIWLYLLEKEAVGILKRPEYWRGSNLRAEGLCRFRFVATKKMWETVIRVGVSAVSPVVYEVISREIDRYVLRRDSKLIQFDVKYDDYKRSGASE